MNSTNTQFPSYDIERSYRWNYEHAPAPMEMEIPALEGRWDFLGLPVSGPLGIAAGPLLNGNWILYYASLGFDVLTYKTVRSRARECYRLPNLVHVPDQPALASGQPFPASDSTTASWAVSFGMPSSEPGVWRSDIESTRRQLNSAQRLSVSVVGTVQEGWSLEQLADDYALCAKWAVESGADVVEANLSCPNVDTCDGQLYQQPQEARVVAEAIRSAIGEVPLVFKIGHLVDPSLAGELLKAIAPSVTAIAMTNSVAGQVHAPTGELMFDGQQRGICGAATFAASLEQVELFVRLIQQCGYPIQIIGVGGASTAEQVERYLARGAHGVHMATAVMLNPSVAIDIKRGLATRRWDAQSSV